MAATIQKILKPTKYRAVDTSTSLQPTIDVINDGGFATDVAESTTGTYWITGDDWVISSGSATCTNDSGNSSENCTQTNLAYALENGATYRVTFTLSGFNQHGGSGGFRIKLHADAGTSAIGTTRKANGTYVEDLTITSGSGSAANQVIIQTYGDPMSGTIDNISVEKLETVSNNNHGQIYSGRALQFDGLSDYLDTGYVLSSTAHTICAWAKVLDNNSNNKFIFDARDANNDGVLLYFNGSEQIGYLVNNTDLIISEKYINQWIRIVATSDGSTQSLYINGQLHSSQSISETISVTSEVRIGARNYSTAESFFDGMLSDVQAWDVGFSASDALYDYLNPESLALSNGGTSLTESNLKLWYPMQDGHRGQQSHILDGSGTGLGLELISDISASAWTKGFPAGASHVDETTTITANADGSVTFETAETTDFQTASIPFVNENGVTYKISITGEALAETDGDGNDNFYWRVGNSVADGHNTANSNMSFRINEGAHTETNYFDSNVSSGTAYLICMFKKASDIAHKFRLDSVSIKAVNQKHHATTEFEGEEMILNNKNQIFDEGTNLSTYGWVGYNSPTSTTVTGDGKLQVVTNGDGATTQGAKLEVSGNITAPVAGRTYRIRAMLDNVDGSNLDATYKFSFGGTAGTITASDGDPTGGVINTSNQEYYADVIAANSTGDLIILIPSAANDAATTFTIDAVSVKELGVALGWTNADQQLDIPQTALQSYNQLAYFEGDNAGGSRITASNFTPSDITSVSMWVWLDAANGQSVGLFDCIDWSGGTNFRIFRKSGSDQISVGRMTGSETEVAETSTGTVRSGKWYHIVSVVPKDSSTGKVKIYINGKLDSTHTSIPTITLSSRQLSFGYGGGLNQSYMDGCINEMAIYGDELTAAEVQGLYNNGKAKDAREVGDNLRRYYKNKGLKTTWTDLGSDESNATLYATDETLLIPAGVDSNRDTQGFLMNRQKDTNSLNLYKESQVASDSSFGPIMKGMNPFTVDTEMNAMSVTCWIKVDDHTNTGSLFNITIDDNTHFLVQIQGTGRFRWTYEGSDTSPTNIRYVTNSSALTSNKWHFLAFLLDHDIGSDSNRVKCYLGDDDTAPTLVTIDDTQNGTQTSPTNDNSLWIGAEATGKQSDGMQIDDVLIYNRTITTDEMTRNYNAGKRSHR